jgi:hypothetical protein
MNAAAMKKFLILAAALSLSACHHADKRPAKWYQVGDLLVDVNHIYSDKDKPYIRFAIVAADAKDIKDHVSEMSFDCNRHFIRLGWEDTDIWKPTGDDLRDFEQFVCTWSSKG